MDEGVWTSIPGVQHEQFGKQVLLTQLDFKTLEAIFEVDPDVQRQLDPRRRREIREFILENLKAGTPFYFSPFVFSSRGQIQPFEGKFRLPAGCNLFISDGQHRAAALTSAISHLQAEREANQEAGDTEGAHVITQYIRQLQYLPITMQIYLDLTTQEERQMFSDLNTERAEAHLGLRAQYDQRDPYATLAREVAESLADRMDIEWKLTRLTQQNGSVMTLTTLRRCLIALFEGTVGEKSGTPYYRNCKPSEVPVIARKFFESWESIFPKKVRKDQTSVYTKSGIQLALAQAACNLVRGEKITYEEAFQQLTLLNHQCTWKADDPLFEHMFDGTSKRLKNHSSTTSIKRTMMKFLNVIEEERAGVLC